MQLVSWYAIEPCYQSNMGPNSAQLRDDVGVNEIHGSLVAEIRRTTPTHFPARWYQLVGSRMWRQEPILDGRAGARLQVIPFGDGNDDDSRLTAPRHHLMANLDSSVHNFAEARLGLLQLPSGRVGGARWLMGSFRAIAHMTSHSTSHIDIQSAAEK